ncbi:phosphomannomutase [Cellvibrio sp. QJXJ]|uniref:phosphomannomutase n=1 Tax=Cellvibrio sp. QJXJ TaxID=2964606 RepID=UPI0021C280C5|nr:phosphomannomutase [Cellvibrio sp. QJXJ]UUA71414.1 phosphomannomutase [Cellvibrio sp. QJXJ]
MTKSLEQIIGESGISFGTSGARGLVSDFSDDVVASFAQSFLRVMQGEFQVSRVAIGIDNRPSSPAMAAACAGAAQALGIAVDYYGILPTPALAYQAMQNSVPAIMVTGSHIPFDRNGLKFYRPTGEITKADELAIVSTDSELTSYTAVLPAINPLAAANYIQRYRDVFAPGIMQGLHIGLYEHSSAGRDLYADLFRSLGAQVTSLERTDTFVPIDTEAVAEADVEKGRRWSQEYGFDALFSTDGDGDRPLIADENGQWLRGDIVGLLCARQLEISALAVPVSCNTAIEKCGAFAKVTRTKIGSPYVIAALEELAPHFASIAGFEANGGFLLGSDVQLNGKLLKALPTRDALLPGIALIAAAANTKISAQVATLPARFTASDRIQNIPTSNSKAFLAEASEDQSALLNLLEMNSKTVDSINTTDGLRISFRAGEIIHLRPSGNAPELRCYAEADNQKTAATLVKNVLDKLQVRLTQTST